MLLFTTIHKYLYTGRFVRSVSVFLTVFAYDKLYSPENLRGIFQQDTFCGLVNGKSKNGQGQPSSKKERSCRKYVRVHSLKLINTHFVHLRAKIMNQRVFNSRLISVHQVFNSIPRILFISFSGSNGFILGQSSN